MVMVETGPPADRTFRGPVVPPVPCSGCARLIDPLRAGHVAVFREQFVFFCDWGCRQDYLAREPDGPRKASSIRPLPPAESAGVQPPSEAIAFPAMSDDGSGSDKDAAAQSQSKAHKSDTGALLLLSATVCGVLAVALALVGDGAWVLASRLTLGALGASLLVVRSYVSGRDPSDSHPVFVLTPVAAIALLAGWACFSHDPVADDATVLTGLSVVATGITWHLMEHLRRDAGTTLARIRSALEGHARKVVPSGYLIVPSNSLRPGEEIVVDAGEMVPADVIISAGDATVLPWLDAATASRKGPGSPMVAGAKLLTGRVRATVSWTGFDRAWLRTSADPTRAAHVVAPVVRTARLAMERGAPAAAALAGLAAFVNNARPVNVIIAVLSAYIAVASGAAASVPALHVLRGVLYALERGVSYLNGHAWDRSAQATALVFCARGTVLLGEPQVAETVQLGTWSPERVLSLVAGAVLAGSNPIASAVLREARARKVRAEAVRSPTTVPGLGVTAVTSDGEACCVGSRALMLSQHIPIASVEPKLMELEAHGKTVMLVAVGAKLVGMVAMQDGLRPGARAAVQYLLDTRIEPILLSGDARETCEAIARALDIEHVRPEVLPSDRAGEVERISESGAVVAVAGRPIADESTLSAADVAIALEAAGSTHGDWAVSLAGDDVRDAARALVTARRARVRARTGLVLCLAPGIACALAIAFGLMPGTCAPVSVLVGSLTAYFHARAVEGRSG